MPTMGLFSTVPPVDPWKLASPKAKTPPSEPTIRIPWLLAAGTRSCSMSVCSVVVLFRLVAENPVA